MTCSKSQNSKVTLQWFCTKKHSRRGHFQKLKLENMKIFSSLSLKNQQLVDNQKVDDSFSVTNQLTLLLSLKFALYTSPITMKAFYTKDFKLWNVLLWFNSFYEIVTHVKPQVNVLYWKSIKRRSFPSQRRHERIFNHLTATSMFVWSCY